VPGIAERRNRKRLRAGGAVTLGWSATGHDHQLTFVNAGDARHRQHIILHAQQVACGVHYAAQVNQATLDRGFDLATRQPLICREGSLNMCRRPGISSSWGHRLRRGGRAGPKQAQQRRTHGHRRTTTKSEAPDVQRLRAHDCLA